MAQPITAAPQVVRRDGLAGAVGYGVIVPDSDPLDPNRRWYGPQGYVIEGQGCVRPPYTGSADFCDEVRDWPDGAPFSVAGGDQHPFIVGAAVECSTFGTDFDTLIDDYRARAARALELVQWTVIASELWSGTVSADQSWSNHVLASTDATELTSSPVPMVEAIALLETMFTGCSPGGVQVIHVPRYAIPYLDAAGLIHTTVGSGRIWTANNSLVVAEGAYTGSSPDGDPPAPPEMWFYSTGVLTARLGPVTFPERDLPDAVSFVANTVAVHAERLAAIDWECCHLAAEVDVTASSGGGS